MVAEADPQSDPVPARDTQNDGAPDVARAGSARWLREHQDLIAVVILFVAGIAMRRPNYMLGHVFWVDEAWVADSVRSPLHALPRITSSTPIGFSFLLRLVPPFGGLERIRLVPLLFGAAIAPLAYWLGRTLDPRSRWRARMLGAVGVLIPVTLRHDLKQYTADAFCTLLLVLLVARAERGWSFRRLAALTGVACLAPLISHTSILVSLPGLTLLVAALLIRGSRRPAAWTAGGAALAAISFAAVYLVFDAPGRTSMLVHYWDPLYVPIDRGGAALSLIHVRWGTFVNQTGLGRLTAGVLLILGCIVLFRVGQYALAALLPALLFESVVLASLKLYPLWDRRTGTYLVAFATTVGVIGLVYCTELVPRRLDRRTTTAIAVLASVVAVGLVARSAVDSWATPIPNEDTRSAVAFITEHREPGDMVLVDFNALYGFAFYWRPDEPGFRTTRTRVDFVPTFDADPGIRVRPDALPSGLDADVRRAARRAAGHTLWIVISHEPRRIYDAYLAAARRIGTATRVSKELISVSVPPRGGGPSL